MKRYYFRPYLKGRGPAYRLDIDSPTDNGDHRWRYGYRLFEVGSNVPLFSGNDFTAPAEYHFRSGYIAREIMGFLTLKPGDIEADWFARYTDDQLTFAEEHAEYLSAEVESRWKVA